MSGDFGLFFDERQMEKYIELFSHDVPQKINKIVGSATDRTLKMARTDVVRAVTEKYTAPPNKVRKSIKTSRTVSGGVVNGKLKVTSGPTALSWFSRSPKNIPKNPRDLMIEVIKGHKKNLNSKKTGRGYFLAKVKSGYVGVFRRKSVSSLPLKFGVGPSIPQMAGNRDIERKISAKMQKVFMERMEHEVWWDLIGKHTT